MTWFNESRIQRWDPLGLMPFARGGAGFLSGPSGVQSRLGSPRSDVHVDADRVLVRVELPGYGAEQVEVSLEGRTLWVRGQSGTTEDGADPMRPFERGFRMPFPIGDSSESEGAGSGVDAQMKNGLLEVHLVRAEADRPRRIPVGEGAEPAKGDPQ